MRIIDESALAEFRGLRRCQLTYESCLYTHAHHGIYRSYARIDVRENLLAVSPECHRNIHLGYISRNEVMEAVGRREGKDPGDLLAALYALARLDSRPLTSDLDDAFGCLTETQADILRAILQRVME